MGVNSDGPYLMDEKGGIWTHSIAVNDFGVVDLNGHLLYSITDDEYATADAWLARTGLADAVAASAAEILAGADVDTVFERTAERWLEAWETDAELATYADAVGDLLASREAEDEPVDMSSEAWLSFARWAVGLLG